MYLSDKKKKQQQITHSLYIPLIQKMWKEMRVFKKKKKELSVERQCKVLFILTNRS